MPAFSTFVSPRGNTIPGKLSDSEIQDVSSFVMIESQKGWSDIQVPDQNCDVYPGC